MTMREYELEQIEDILDKLLELPAGRFTAGEVLWLGSIRHGMRDPNHPIGIESIWLEELQALFAKVTHPVQGTASPDR